MLATVIGPAAAHVWTPAEDGDALEESLEDAREEEGETTMPEDGGGEEGDMISRAELDAL